MVVARGSSGWKATATALEATAAAGNKGSRCELPVIALFRLQKMQSKGQWRRSFSPEPGEAAAGRQAAVAARWLAVVVGRLEGDGARGMAAIDEGLRQQRKLYF